MEDWRASYIHIRNAQPEDALQIHDVHTHSVRTLCQGHYTPEQIDGWIGHRTPEGYLESIERKEIFVAERAGRIVGFGHAVSGEILAIYVDPVWSRKGIGRQLLHHAITVAQPPESAPIQLEATLNAQSFYERCGFVEVRRTVLKRRDVQLPVVVMQYRSLVSPDKPVL
jgi:GNAT superfamily N-acetyltransferase